LACKKFVTLITNGSSLEQAEEKLTVIGLHSFTWKSVLKTKAN